MTETTAGADPAVLLPDSHVHSQWSWDAVAGSMEGTCERAVAIALPAVAFTEHADFTPRFLEPGEKIREHWYGRVRDDAEIAAICRDLGATLATRNTADFEETGIELINPWNQADH